MIKKIKIRMTNNKKKRTFCIWTLHLIYSTILIMIKTMMKFLRFKITINYLICLSKIQVTKKMKIKNRNKHCYSISKTTHPQNQMKIQINNKILYLTFRTKMNNKAMIKTNSILRRKVQNWLNLIMLFKNKNPMKVWMILLIEKWLKIKYKQLINKKMNKCK